MAGIKAMGAKLSYTDGAGEEFVAHLTSLGSINTTNDEIDVTDHDSPNGNQEFIAGAKAHDNLSFAGNIAPGDDTFTRIWALADSRSVEEWTAVYADGSKMEFEGYFASVAMGEQSTDGLMGYEGEIKISGEVVYTPAPTSA